MYGMYFLSLSLSLSLSAVRHKQVDTKVMCHIRVRRHGRFSCSYLVCPFSNSHGFLEAAELDQNYLSHPVMSNVFYDDTV